MTNLLLVEDDPNLGLLLQEFLTIKGYPTQLATNGELGLQQFMAGKFELCILDVMMPRKDGFTLAKEIRMKQRDIPIIFLTAKSMKEDTIQGFSVGADDYMTKPFDQEELLLRIKAILRRRGIEEHPGAPSHENESISFGPFILNMATRTLMRDEEVVPITTGEFSVLKVFGRHPKVPLSRDKLMELARGREYEAYDRSLDVQISRLRRLIEKNPSKPAFIQTVWGMGYVFVPDGGR